MAKYFYDCEFLEGTQKKKFWWGNTVPTIDLISIGIVSEDGREFYAINKDFNLKEAWNRFDLKKFEDTFHHTKVYWIRENVLKPIFKELSEKEQFESWAWGGHFSYKELKRLLKKYGKTNKQIAKDICSFIDARGNKENPNDWFYPSDGSCYPKEVFTKNVEFYGYYSAYDHVALCWLFGKMIDLPTGFPMYTIDLKQELDRIADLESLCTNISFKDCLNDIKNHKEFPKQTNDHNSLSDAKFNFELYKFLNE